jgi:hypothetical protein
MDTILESEISNDTTPLTNTLSPSNKKNEIKVKILSYISTLCMFITAISGFIDLHRMVVISNIILSMYALLFSGIMIGIEIKADRLTRNIQLFSTFEGRGVFHLITGISVVGVSLTGTILGPIISINGIMNIILFHKFDYHEI